MTAVAAQHSGPVTDVRQLVFISDLHLATDADKYDFSAQDELVALLERLIASPEPVDLIIAGDFFDLLQLTDATPGETRVDAFRVAFERAENLALIDALQRLNQLPHHRTIYLVGNHDAESGWNDALREYLLASGIVSEISLAYQYTFADQGGNGCLVYCEHGNDYDGVNTIGDYRNPFITPLGTHIVTDLVNYLEALGVHARTDAPTTIADIDNIHPLGLIPWWFISNFFYRQVRRVISYVILPSSLLYLLVHLIPIYIIFDQFGDTILARGLGSLPTLEVIMAAVIVMFDSSVLFFFIAWMLVRFDFARTRRRYGLLDPDDIFRRGARHYRRTCEALASGRLRPVHWSTEELWTGCDLFVYGHTHSQELTTLTINGIQRAIANTGTWTRKVIRLKAHLKLPPVFVPTYQLNYVTVAEREAGIVVTLWECPKALSYRLPWSERLAILGRRRPPMQPKDLAPRMLEQTRIPFRPGVADRAAATAESQPSMVNGQ